MKGSPRHRNLTFHKEIEIGKGTFVHNKKKLELIIKIPEGKKGPYKIYTTSGIAIGSSRNKLGIQDIISHEYRGATEINIIFYEEENKNT